MIRMKNSVDSKLKNSKDALSEKFLGHAGIHSIGLSNGHIVIFVEEPKSNEFRALFNRIKRAAKPYSVDIKECSRPTFASF
ncbi:MAG TPA: hypothetical protein DG048_17765 [Pseudoalteromonas sp.]|nr:hypothetical protein [Pseudoalteromonas sp.]|tara:strand:- start:51 stop:293 length:243 start_codon:yes stop_codon:yes gene_type:complete